MVDHDDELSYLVKVVTQLKSLGRHKKSALTVASTILKFDAVQIWPVRDRVFYAFLVQFCVNYLFFSRFSKIFEAVVG